MKLATWNVNSLAIRLPHLLSWLAEHAPDVVALQETKLTDERFPAQALADAGWRGVWHGQPTYNGVALLARGALADDLTDVQRGIPGFDDPQARVIAATVRGVRVVGIYVPNGQAPGSDKYVYKMGWLERLQHWLADELHRHPRLALMGDFNIAPADADVHDPQAWAGQIMCTDDERAAFARLQAAGLVDTFRRFEQPPRTFSWWDYRQLAFRRNAGLRIDHILASEALATRTLACAIDKAPRRLERPSDHAPVLATFELDAG